MQFVLASIDLGDKPARLDSVLVDVAIGCQSRCHDRVVFLGDTALTLARPRWGSPRQREAMPSRHRAHERDGGHGSAQVGYRLLGWQCRQEDRQMTRRIPASPAYDGRGLSHRPGVESGLGFSRESQRRARPRKGHGRSGR
ncbi:MAG: hypothetical protein D6690_17765 [Nitrospirae bacterium]|nr:MAG: hypothetical protein D6690_17765 [Nitrospirota bacterium]